MVSLAVVVSALANVWNSVHNLVKFRASDESWLLESGKALLVQVKVLKGIIRDLPERTWAA